MRKYMILFITAIGGLVFWTGLQLTDTTNGWFRDSMAPAGKTRARRTTPGITES